MRSLSSTGALTATRADRPFQTQGETMNKSPYQHLSSTFRIGALTLRNRIVMAPMSTNMSAPDGSVTPAQIAFYRARAEGGVGMITVEFCCVDAATGRSEHRQLTLETVIHVDGHQRLVQAIKGAGAAACLQLQHGGQGAMRGLVTGGMAVAPSDVPSRKDPTRLSARALTGAEIEHLIECYGRTAELGVLAGYDAFELHGAHGYLLTSFLSPMMNHRDDAWGGDEARRLNFPCRVIERVKKAIGGRPLIYRLSADEFSPAGLAIEDMERIAPKLAAAGADVLHVSIGTGWTGMDKVIEPMSTPEGWRLPYVRRIREVAGVPVIGVGQIRSPEMADAAIARGDADLIALGRPLLADPEWVNKALYGEVSAIRPCTSCNYCVIMHAGETGRIGCAENPRTGHELDTIPEAGALRGQSAIVVGGGPGGMAAALMLDQAGFEVELFEARPSLGGGLLASAAPPFKEKLNWYRDYLERQLAHSGVKLRLGTPFNLQVLGERKPAIIILAVGGKQVELPIPGIDEAVVRDAYEILMGDTRGLPEAGDRPVLVYGGGETGCETAEYLSERGHAVVLVSRSPARQLARSAEPVYRGVLRTRLTQNPRVRIIDSTSIVNIGADGEITLQDGEGTSSTLNVSCVMIAQGRRPDTAITEQLLAAGLPAMAIGDAHKGGRIGDAVHQAYAAVRAVCATGAPALQLAC
ncbi:MAG: FAD-dependent oxidoreductase [Rhodocyclaceae bacterium]|jgi:2,4-dienoyl-CoA reductase-like NADH-dependent reductase (Old Yellow Enzyme family)/NADPH-dependent 2,4-dienoyl-CoA reductase/sulfur reductase-like enzyme|nr:FAD-dependent oxidoreductase [Rhodocyclaceae bacterium]